MFGKSDLEDVMYGRRSSPVVSSVLRPLSLLYGLVVRLRKGLFRVGILARKRAGKTVISVGNLTLGGTGKTPAVISIANFLTKKGRRPAVISRGYGRNDESRVVIVSDGNKVQVDAATGGDEPVLIGSKLKGVPVVVGSDRYRAAALAQERFAIDSIILDDGFQHLRLERNLDIVLLDASDPFGNGRLFPAGILREPVSGLERAQVVLLTGVDRIDALGLDRLKQTIRKFTQASIFSSRTVPSDLVDILNGEHKPLSALRGTRILALSGIARPAGFLSVLQSLGADVKAQLVFPDHYPYVTSDLARLFQQAADEKVSMIVTTEKDAVRLKRLKPEGIWALRIELDVLEKSEWESLVVGSI